MKNPPEGYSTWNQYYWANPKEMPRLKAEDMHGNEGVLALCETILTGIRSDAESIARGLAEFPHNQDLIREALSMDRILRSEEITAMSFGASLSYAEEFRQKCPGGVFRA